MKLIILLLIALVIGQECYFNFPLNEESWIVTEPFNQEVTVFCNSGSSNISCPTAPPNSQEYMQFLLAFPSPLSVTRKFWTGACQPKWLTFGQIECTIDPIKRWIQDAHLSIYLNDELSGILHCGPISYNWTNFTFDVGIKPTNYSILQLNFSVNRGFIGLPSRIVIGEIILD